MDFERQERVCSLLDCYQTLLTEKQRDTMQSYFNYNMSLNEIAEQLKITKQGVKANIEGALSKLNFYEDNLHLMQKLKEYRDIKNQFSDNTLLWQKLDNLFEE